MEYTGEEDIEGQILDAIKEVLAFSDPNTVKASIILNRLRTILGLKNLASAPDLYEACCSAIVEIEDGSANHAHLILSQAIAKAEKLDSQPTCTLGDRIIGVAQGLRK